MFVLRRTNASRVPIAQGKTIGDQLPALIANSIECYHTAAEWEKVIEDSRRISDIKTLLQRSLSHTKTEGHTRPRD